MQSIVPFPEAVPKIFCLGEQGACVLGWQEGPPTPVACIGFLVFGFGKFSVLIFLLRSGGSGLGVMGLKISGHKGFEVRGLPFQGLGFRV